MYSQHNVTNQLNIDRVLITWCGRNLAHVMCRRVKLDPLALYHKQVWYYIE